MGTYGYTEVQKERLEKVKDQPLLLKVEQAAKLLNVSRSGLYVLLTSGEIPGVIRFGRSVRIRRDALEAWICAKSGDDANDASQPAA